MSKPTHPAVKRLIAYLRRKLIEQQVSEGGRCVFSQAAPHTFWYRDEVDTIVVRVEEGRVWVTNDGPEVTGGMECIRFPLHLEDDVTDDQYFDERILQAILHLF